MIVAPRSPRPAFPRSFSSLASALAPTLLLVLAAPPSLIAEPAGRAAAAREPQSAAIEGEVPRSPAPLFADRGASSPPITFRLRSHKVHLPARVAGESAEEVWLLLDTGANMSVISESLAGRLGLELRNQGESPPDSSGRRFRFAFAGAPAFRLGSDPLPAVILPPQGMAVIERGTQGANGHPSDILLGADFFRRFVVDIDYPGRRLTLHDPERYAYRGSGVVLPLTFTPNGQPLVEARVTPFAEPEACSGPRAAAGASMPSDRPGPQARSVTLLVDTGDRGLLTLYRSVADQQPWEDLLPGAARNTVGVSVRGEVVYWMGFVAALELGPLRFTDLPVSAAMTGDGQGDLRPGRDGTLGGELLERFRVIFDYARERLILEPRAGGAGAGSWRFSTDLSGLFLAAAGDRLEEVTILAVAPGEEGLTPPALAAGLRPGGRILRVDGQDAGALGLDAVRERLRRPGSTVRLTVEQGGATREVELGLEEWLGPEAAERACRGSRERATGGAGDP